MKASALDRRVDREARLLVRAARGLSGGKREGELRAAVRAVEAALEQGDRLALRAALPALDAAVDAAAADDGKSTAREYVESIGVAVIVALLLRAFVVEAFKIPSASMIPSLEIGDHIFVNKLVYGPRIPYTERRLFTLRGPARGEIVVFNYPCQPEKDFIKRVVAVAGDTVEVRCGVLRVNGTPVPQELVPGPCSYDDQDEATGRWSKATCSRYREHHGGFVYDVLMHEGRPGKQARRVADPSGGYPVWGEHADFPKLIAEGGRDDHGQPLLVDPELPHCEGLPAAPAAIVRTVAAGAQPADACGPQAHYVVPAGHVFAMGDNRANSHDSRFWGPVPLAAIKGKAMFVWWSLGPGGWFGGGIRAGRMGDFVHQP